ncbi:hypothetical protein SAMN05216525_14423 [Bradyrhizobium sp. Gha]|nr:hypothetical protein SAMN05216525_14423 [Bradyrhizobium sp. Gha]
MSVPPNAVQPPASATSTDPQTLGYMRDFPPSPDRTITFQDGSFRNFPELRWAWSNIRQLVPTVTGKIDPQAPVADFVPEGRWQRR